MVKPDVQGVNYICRIWHVFLLLLSDKKPLMFISSRLRVFLVLIRTYIISQIRLYQEHNVAVKLPLSFRKKKHLTFNFAAFAYNRLFQNTLCLHGGLYVVLGLYLESIVLTQRE